MEPRWPKEYRHQQTPPFFRPELPGAERQRDEEEVVQRRRRELESREIHRADG